MSPPDPAEPESPDPGALELRRARQREYLRRRLLSDPDYNRRRHYAQKAEDPVGYWRKKVLRKCRQRALEQCVPFCLTESDLVLPKVCPVLGIAVRHANGRPEDHSPSVDRLVPDLGYVPGNIAVISNRANTIKNSGTAEEHRRIADWMDRMTAKSR